MTVVGLLTTVAAVLVGAVAGSSLASREARDGMVGSPGGELPSWGTTVRYVDRIVDRGRGSVRVVVAMVRVDLQLVVRRFGLRARDVVVGAVHRRLQRRFPDAFVGTGPAGELVVIVSGAPTGRGDLAGAIHGVLTSPVRIDRDVVDVEATVGVVSSDEVGGTGHDLLAAVVDATGGPGLAEVGLARRREIELHRAIRSSELNAVYQSMVDPARGQRVGVEALVRWARPGGRPIPAGEFLPLAQRTDLDVEIDRWMLQRVRCELASGVLSLAPGSLVSVNLSARSLLRASSTDAVEALTGVASALGCRVCVELTETTPLDLERGGRAIERLRAMGVSLAIDDFGAGFASIGYLRALRPDWLKLDRGLTAGVGSSDSELQLVALIVEIAANLGIRVCAEGVETAQQAHTLALLGCDALQGFHYSTPMPASQLPRAGAQRWSRPTRRHDDSVPTGSSWRGS